MNRTTFMESLTYVDGEKEFLHCELSRISFLSQVPISPLCRTLIFS